ncbi:hypothetical protein EVAR_84765_1 [Eumeta japonica]|uniref:Uncharacterized protein n=1 Tax=Eumeta variegata TaxID=151549 RepID=A0A4C1U892_EUMVA|nr:hypothetical protein EVAR_84765_1 [Eumeta japonica]
MNLTQEDRVDWCREMMQRFAGGAQMLYMIQLQVMKAGLTVRSPKPKDSLHSGDPDSNFQRCMRNCPVTSEYNPVCGSDNARYENPSWLSCAQACGASKYSLLPVIVSSTYSVTRNYGVAGALSADGGAISVTAKTNDGHNLLYNHRVFYYILTILFKEKPGRSTALYKPAGSLRAPVPLRLRRRQGLLCTRISRIDELKARPEKRVVVGKENGEVSDDIFAFRQRSRSRPSGARWMTIEKGLKLRVSHYSQPRTEWPGANAQESPIQIKLVLRAGGRRRM